MKLAGLFGGDFRIMEELEPAQLEGLSPDFAWLDVDSVDNKTQLLLKKLFGIGSLDEFGFPTTLAGEGYDTVVLNYYIEQVRREVLVFVLDKYVITVHPGKDAVCEETMATVNEMLVSGGFGAGSVLLALFEAIAEKGEKELTTTQESMRGLEMQLKRGTANVYYLSQINNATSEMERVFSETKGQLGDIIAGNIPIRGVGETKGFIPVYSRMNALFTYADDLSRMAEGYSNELISMMWWQLSKTKNISFGLSALSLSLAIAALLYVMFPRGLLGIAQPYPVVGMIFLGALAFFAMQRSMKFRLA